MNRSQSAVGSQIAQATDGSTAIVLNAHFEVSVPVKPNDLEIADFFEPQAALWRSGFSDAVLLRAEERAVPYLESQYGQLKRLLDWANETKLPIGLQIWAGPAGAGKTRLLLEACDRLARSGWDAGFLRSNPACNQVAAAEAWWKLGERRRLLVIDYAEARPHETICLVDALLRSRVAKQTRIILLVRNTKSWWFELLSKSKSIRALAEGDAFGGTQWIHPIGLDAPNTESQFNAALNAFAKKLSLCKPDNVSKSIPAFLAETQGEPLYIQMAALATLRGDRPTSLYDLLDSTLNREGGYWLRLLARFSLGDEHLSAFSQAMAAITLVGGLPNITKLPILLSSLPISGSLPDAERIKFQSAIALAYPRGHGIDALRPDRLGEALLLREIRRDPEFVASCRRVFTERIILNTIFSILERVSLHQTRSEVVEDRNGLLCLLDNLFESLRPRTVATLREALKKMNGTSKRNISKQMLTDCEVAFEMAELASVVRLTAMTARNVYQIMRTRKISFNKIFDIFEIEVIVSSLPECYLALGILHQLYKPIPGRFKDYIAIPTRQGYQAIHTTLVNQFGMSVNFRIVDKNMWAVQSGLPDKFRPGY